MSGGSLTLFVRDSNRVENIHRDPTRQEIEAHKAFLALPEVTVSDLEKFVSTVAGASLRRRIGRDVRVGTHVPPPGGPKIETELSELLTSIHDAVERRAEGNGHAALSPWEAHVEYETLHPFSDGNGRSGRVLWAWQMQREGRDPFALPVLQLLYYAALDGAR